MLRNITLAFAAAAVVAITAVPAPASAHYTGYRHFHGARPLYHCHTDRKWVKTRWGWQKVKVRRCHSKRH
jgi:hypothetical protein